jgi:tetratricopeptide (TPR) repeat protein
MKLRRLACGFLFCLVVSAGSSATALGQESAPDAPSAAMTASATGLAEARKLMQQGRPDEAIAKLQKLDQSTKGVALELGNAYYKKSDFSRAITYLKKANTEDPANQEAAQLLGMAYFASGHPGDAIPLLEHVQGSMPHGNADGYYILGTCYIQIRNYDGARNAFAKMFGVPGDSAAAYLFTARMLLRQEFDPVAEQYAQKAVSLDSKLPLAHYLLGELDLYKARLPEAIAEFQKELETNPANAATYYKLGDAYARAQKYDEAQTMLQRSIRLDSTSSVPFILMGQVLQKKGDYDLAVLSLKHAVTMEPNNPTAHYLLGQTYREMGRKEEATDELKRAQELHGTEDLQ